MASRSLDTNAPERIPFYRNVKVIGILIQVIFLIAILIGLYLLVSNVITGAQRIGISLGFGWMDDRSGIPMTEPVIPYDENIHPYWRTILLGFLNTLKVSLVGVVLATLLGVGVALMRLSNNWMLRQIASWYVETVRNIPLVVQIFFWFTVVFIPSLPIGVNARQLGNIFINNNGMAIPWPYYSANVLLWLPWVIAAIIVATVAYNIRRTQIIRSERPGNPWPPALISLLLISVVGYFVANAMSSFPEGMVLEVNERTGKLTSFVDENGNGEHDRGERTVRAVPVVVTADNGEFTAIPDKRTEIRQEINSTFRLPRFRQSEYSSASVELQNPGLNENLSIHFDVFPSIGRVYEDRNGNERFDEGEEFAEDGIAFEGTDYTVILSLEDFERKVVTDPFGETRFPRFRGEDDNVQVALGNPGPFAYSRPSFPTERSLISGGNVLTNSYLALLIALVVYTASFIAEIVRGGILAVPKGQREAANAVGLNGAQTFNLVIFPQATRIIVPPMISQYLNLTKNSSLGLFAAYTEFFKVSEIVSNQTGASIPTILLMIIGYLIVSLTFSLILNIYNERIKLVER